MDSEEGGSSTKKASSGLKRAASSTSKQKSHKKPKVINEQKAADSDEKHKQCLKIVLDEDTTINYETLAIQTPIVDWEMLEILDRQDLVDLHKIVMQRFQENGLKGHDLNLWGDLRIMFDSNEDDEVWLSQQEWKLLSWKLYETCGVHTLVVDGTLVTLNMFVERRYPLIKEVLQRMLESRLEADAQSTLALDLIKFIKLQLKE
ncbi:hypothetical protein Tco_0496547 [Tanacetum coccineum]